MTSPTFSLTDWPAGAALGFILPIGEEVGLGAAVLLTIVGMVLHWQLPRRRMALEDELKDGTLTEAQVQARLRLLAICAPLATIIGIVLLLCVVLASAD
jgi:hypothetical protein